MTKRTYGQYCGIARALELVGERWSLLIVRDLLLHPKRYTDLQRGLPRIPTNVLSSRLKDLEASGVIQRRVLPRPASAVVYELTAYGRELEDVLLRLGRWGARVLDEPAEGEIGYVDPSIRALRATFHPEEAGALEVVYELRFGEFVVFARIENGALEVGQGEPTDPDLMIDVSSSLTPLLTGDVTVREAVESGRVRLTGDPALLDRFVEIFRMPPDWFADALESAREESDGGQT